MGKKSKSVETTTIAHIPVYRALGMLSVSSIMIGLIVFGVNTAVLLISKSKIETAVSGIGQISTEAANGAGSLTQTGFLMTVNALASFGVSLTVVVLGLIAVLIFNASAKITGGVSVVQTRTLEEETP